MVFIDYIEIGRSKIMSLQNGNFHKTLLSLLEYPHSEVRYNTAGVIGYVAINGEFLCVHVCVCMCVCVMGIFNLQRSTTSVSLRRRCLY